jgi:hypothetical protein
VFDTRAPVASPLQVLLQLLVDSSWRERSVRAAPVAMTRVRPLAGRRTRLRACGRSATKRPTRSQRDKAGNLRMERMPRVRHVRLALALGWRNDKGRASKRARNDAYPRQRSSQRCHNTSRRLKCHCLKSKKISILSGHFLTPPSGRHELREAVVTHCPRFWSSSHRRIPMAHNVSRPREPGGGR